MRTNSGAGEAKNNNHDPTMRDREGEEGPGRTVLRDREGKKGPAQKSALLDIQEDQAGAKPPSDSRGAAK